MRCAATTSVARNSLTGTINTRQHPPRDCPASPKRDAGYRFAGVHGQMQAIAWIVEAAEK